MNTELFSDERLREEIATVSEVAGDGQGCPAPEKLWLSGRDELDQEENEGIILHMAGCTACASAWKIARELAPETPVAPFRPKKRRLSGIHWSQLAVAAVIVIAVGASAMYVFSPAWKPEPVYREQGEYRVQSDIAEDESLPRGSFVLRWTPGPEGTTYDVLVTDDELETIEKKLGLEGAVHQVTEAVLSGQHTGERLFWQVTAYLPDGTRVESDTYSAIVE